MSGNFIGATGFTENEITGSLSQNIIGLDYKELIINDKPDSVKYEDIFIPLTAINEPVLLTAERTYPPIRNFTTGNETVSGEPYGNGTYIMSWSSSGTGGNPSNCFNTANIIGGSWGAGQYSNGLYLGSAFIVPDYLGDWLKIQLPVPIILSSIAFIMRSSTIALQDRAPRDYKIYGSNDGINWVELINKVGAVYNTLFIHEETTSGKIPYSHYALVVNKLNTGATSLNFDEWYINGKEIITSVPEGSPITHKTFSLNHNPITLTHNFTNLNDLTSWTNYATSKGMNNGVFDVYDTTLDGIYRAGTAASSLNYRLPTHYNFVSVSYGNPSSTNNVALKINSIDVDFCGPNQFKTYSQSYNKYDLLTILEGSAIISGNIIITLSNSSLNTYSLAVQSGTSIQINNQPFQYLLGDYIINVGETQSSVFGFNNPYPLQNISYIDVKYSMTQKITNTINYKKDGFIKYVSSSGTNPKTGNWKMIDIDSQLLSQFGGNLNINRINDLSLSLFEITSNLDNITSNLYNITSNLYNGDTSITSNIIYIKNELQNETQIIPTKTVIYRVKDLEDRFTQIANGYNSGNLIDPETGQIISNTISAAFSAIGASIANIGNVAAIWYFLGQCAIAAQVGQTRAETANGKADRLLDIWEDSGNNVYHKKSGNVGIGTGFGSVLNNRLEVNGNINISNGNKYKINGFNLAYSNLDGVIPDNLTSNFITHPILNSCNYITHPILNSCNYITHPILNSCNYIKTLPIATTASLGTVQIGANLSITPQGVLSANPASSVPIATTTTTGIIQVGTGLSITAQGLLSVPIATNGILGGVKPDVDTIIVNPTTGLISLSGSDIFLNGTDNRAYGWTSSTSALGRVAVAGSYSTGSIINDVVLRSAGNLILQSGITNPALVINATNQALFRNAVGIGTTTISTGNILDVGGILKIATDSGTERLTITSTGVQVKHTLNVSTGVNAGGLIRLGGFSDDSSLDLAIIQNREYATNKGELLLFRGDNIAGITGTGPDRIRLRAGAIAFDVYPATTTSATTENIRMYLDGNGNVGIGNTAPIAPLCIGNSALANNDGFIVLEKCTTVGTTRQFRIGLNANFELAIGDYGNNNTAGTWVQALRILSSGAVSFNNSVWHTCFTGNRRLYFESNATTYIEGYGGTPIVFRNGNDNSIGNIDSSGNLAVNGFLYAGSYIYTNGFIQGNGVGGSWRIVRPDSWVRLKDTGDTTHLDFAAGKIYAHQELTAASSFVCSASATFNGAIYCYNGVSIYNNLLVRMLNITNTNTDYICCSGNTSYNTTNDKILYIANGSFTGFHRNYTNDDLFDDEKPEVFKNTFIGCIVISSGKIKTDYSTIEEEISKEEEKINSKVEWKSGLDKEGIFIEDALPIVKLSRVKKDKRVFGVLGDPNRNCNSKNRLIVNSVGEGGIMVCNTNGDIGNGDYIQSSDVLGHGEKQDDDILHNYTVAKATIDCNFELNSPYYECIERPDGIRTAFISCTYHAG